MAKSLVFSGARVKTSGGLKSRFDQEQERQDCEQEATGTRQEGLQQHQGLDHCRIKGQKVTCFEGLCSNQEGHSSIHQDQELLQVSIILSEGPGKCQSALTYITTVHLNKSQHL